MNTLTIISNGRTIYDGEVLSGNVEQTVDGLITVEAWTPPSDQAFLSGTFLA